MMPQLQLPLRWLALPLSLAMLAGSGAAYADREDHERARKALEALQCVSMPGPADGPGRPAHVWALPGAAFSDDQISRVMEGVDDEYRGLLG